MAIYEMQLLSRIIRTGELNTILNWGLGTEDFVTMEGRAMFQHILTYHSRPETHGSVLGEYSSRAMFPNFVLCDDTTMSTESLCYEVRKNRLYIDLQVAAKHAMDHAGGDPMKAAAYLQYASQQILTIGSAKSTDVTMDQAASSIMYRYQLKKSGVDLSVCPWPWVPLQLATGGIEADDYAVLYGRPKSMKSWVLAAIIAFVFLQGKRALIYTKEMTAENIFQRVIAILSNIRYQELRSGQLDQMEEFNLNSTVRYIQHMRAIDSYICLSGKDAQGQDTVPWLKSKVEQYQPDIVFIDGLYLMSDVRKAQKDNFRVQNISRDVRQMVLDTKKPVICTLQANRQAAKHQEANLDELAFSDAIGQDATLIMRVINDKDNPTISLIVGGSREFALDGFRIWGVPATCFDYHSTLTARDVMQAKEGDKEDEAKRLSKRKANGRANGQITAEEHQAVIDVTQRFNQYS